MLNAIVTLSQKLQLRGRERLWYVAKRRLGGYVRARNRYGVVLALDPADYVDGFVLREGFYESEVFEAIKEAVHPGDTFWDVGANSGHHAITLAYLTPTADIVAFEPSPKEIERIVRSVRVSCVSGIRVLPFALSDETKLAVFNLCRTNAGRNALETWGSKDDYEQTLTQCLTGDELVRQGFAVPSVVKVDVEGAELRVLNGMSGILTSPRCRRIIFEAGPQADESTDPINQLLSTYKFRVRRLARLEKTSHNLENFVADKTSAKLA